MSKEIICRVAYSILRDDIMPGKHIIYIPYFDGEESPVDYSPILSWFDDAVAPEERAKTHIALALLDLYDGDLLHLFHDPNLDLKDIKYHVCELTADDFEMFEPSAEEE